MIPTLSSRNPADAAQRIRDYTSLPAVPRASDLHRVIRLMGAEVHTFARGSGVAGRTEPTQDPPAESHRKAKCSNASWSVSTEHGLPLTRLRFTLAHEIGHLVLRMSDMTIPKEEPWCNEFAAELLMPQESVKNRYQTLPHTAGTVQSLSGHAQVSFNAAFVRLNTLLGWKKSLITLELIDRRWCVADMLLATTAVHYRLDLAASIRDAMSPSSDESIWIPFRFQRETIEILCEYVHVSTRRRKLIYDRDPVDRICRQIDRETRCSADQVG